MQRQYFFYKLSKQKHEVENEITILSSLFYILWIGKQAASSLG